jgi:hypothetical protein
MSELISRCGFCPECFNSGRPKTNQKFLVNGGTSGELKALLALHNGRKGFTPHFYMLRKVVDDKVFYQKLCGVCGTYEVEEEDGRKYLCINESQWSGWIKTSLTNWNALVLRFKNTGFEI